MPRKVEIGADAQDLTVKFAREQYRALAILARRERASIAHFVRKAVDHYLQRPDVRAEIASAADDSERVA